MPRRLPLWPLVGLPLLISAWSRGLWAPDEPRYAQVAREVFTEPGLLAMRLCGEVYPDKPPLLFWLSGLLGLVSGWSPAAMRLVSVAATFITAWLVARLARRWWGEREAAWAPALFLGTAMLAEHGGRLQLDPLLTLCTTGALAALELGEGERSWRGRARLAGLLLGLGVLTKGPVAILVVVLVLAAWRLLPGARTSGAPRGPRLDPVAVVLTLLPAGLWVAAVVATNPDLADHLLFGQHAGRLTQGGAVVHAGPWYKPSLRLALLFLPWTPLLVAGLARGWSAARARPAVAAHSHDRGLARAFAWAAVLLLFFTLIPPKRDLYLLPAYPALALVTARWLCAHATRARGRVLLLGVGPALLLLVGLALAVAGPAAGAIEAAREPLAELPELEASLAWRLPLGALPLIVGAAVALAALRRDRVRRAAAATLAAFTGGAALSFALVFPHLDDAKSSAALGERLAELHAERAQLLVRPEIPVFGLRPEGPRFYSRAPVVPARHPEFLDDQTLGSERGMLEGHDPALFEPVALLHAWRRVLGQDLLAVVSERLWMTLEDTERERFRVLHEGRIGRRRVLILGTR